jgi:glycosyltransferase involved in cell wall biosynthesis
MRVLLYSPAFPPSVGGIETSQAMLADGLARLGQEVTVVTRTPAAGADALPYRVLRRPKAAALLREARACDVFYQANVSLRGLWPLLLVRRPWAVSHHSWYCRTGGRVAWQDRLKRRLLRFAAASIAVSHAVAADLDTPSLVIPNAYREQIFHRMQGVERTRDLAFLGRLVSDKGADLLIAALGRLAEQGLRPSLTLMGDGPELAGLRRQAEALGVAAQVDFTGMLSGPAAARQLNRHRILVVPSRYEEPFGIVALEGIACGCVIVGSCGGGLPEAIGPCGVTFPNGDVERLAAALADLLRHPERLTALAAGAAEHLEAHGSERVARRYLAALEAAAAGRRPGRRAAQESP